MFALHARRPCFDGLLTLFFQLVLCNAMQQFLPEAEMSSAFFRLL